MGDDHDEAASLLQAFVSIAPSRTKYELDHFVIGRHETKEQCFAQCVLELQNALVAKMRATISERMKLREIAWLEARGRGEEFDLDAKKRADCLDRAAAAKIDLFIMRLASLGNDYQIEHLNMRRKQFGHFSREQIDATDPERWRLRAIRQAAQDVSAHGRVSVGNQDMLRMMDEPEPSPRDFITETEQRFLSIGNVRILIVVPTLIDKNKIKAEGLDCLKGWSLPAVFQQRTHVIDGRPVADAYNEAAFTAIKDRADFLLCVEDDHVIPAGTFEKLWSVYQQHGPRAIVGAWYPQKRDPRTGAAICLRGDRREFLTPDDGHDQSAMRGGPVEVYAITQGFTLIPTKAFDLIEPPWFVTTKSVSQDSYFSQLAREAGYKLLCDTSARIRHVCRETGRVFE